MPPSHAPGDCKLEPHLEYFLSRHGQSVRTLLSPVLLHDAKGHKPPARIEPLRSACSANRAKEASALTKYVVKLPPK